MSQSKQFLLDQMFDLLVREALLDQGYNVVSVSEIGLATADDAEIMQWAIRNERTVITLDEHFGDWSVLPLNQHPGVIRLKINPATTTTALNLLLPFLESHQDFAFENRLVIVREQGVRWISTTELTS
jgi:predicted nuclease of predicted toxin-antitoxin system